MRGAEFAKGGEVCRDQIGLDLLQRLVGEVVDGERARKQILEVREEFEIGSPVDRDAVDERATVEPRHGARSRIRHRVEHQEPEPAKVDPGADVAVELEVAALDLVADRDRVEVLVTMPKVAQRLEDLAVMRVREVGDLE